MLNSHVFHACLLSIKVVVLFASLPWSDASPSGVNAAPAAVTMPAGETPATQVALQTPVDL